MKHEKETGAARDGETGRKGMIKIKKNGIDGKERTKQTLKDRL